MATADLNKLQQILANAEENEAVIGQIRKNMTKVADLIAEINTMLEPGYKPAAKERKPRAASTGTGKRPGRPRKSEAAA
ncbi:MULTISPECIES: hypothetical protein [Hymenobacter]|uniref:IS66 family transposase n=1 Tax=Hymenobacter guriensis TaxID=2793065 RepID=A0ABS0L083_9BACT|nr:MULTISPECIES: hypothetical protein [Hymenobacter]MBG8553522.1 hypothetical protein [Hymenobacter guriensis]MCR5886266.1 hypothetical protein [Hymenobacter sp. J193]